MKRRLFFVLFLIASMTSALWAKDVTAGKIVKMGKPAADFSLKDIEGKEFQLSAQKGKIVFLHFWSAKCPFVLRYEERLQAIAHDYGSKGVVVAAVDSNANDSLDEIKKVAAERKLNYPVLIDSGNKIADQFGAITTPHVFIMDQEGKLAYEGAVDNQGWSEKKVPNKHYARQALDALLAGQKVKPSETNTAGCTIKRNSK